MQLGIEGTMKQYLLDKQKLQPFPDKNALSHFMYLHNF